MTKKVNCLKVKPDEQGKKVPVVAVGASAGGLGALESFFKKIPPDTGMAFVVIQHLSPDYKSVMGDLMSRYSPLEISRVEEGMHLEKNTIYLIPPGKGMTIEKGIFHLKDRPAGSAHHLPIDMFLFSLAKYSGAASTAVILSGTGSDGTKGVTEIKKSGAGGTGLGLSITKNIIEAHGGTIEARNNDDGGASIMFTLPTK